MKVKQKLILASSILLATVGGGLASEEGRAQWSYGGSTNPTRWGELDEDFAICDRGRNQSPVNLEGGSVGAQANIQFNYQGTPLVVENKDKTIKIPYREGSWVRIDGRRYDLVQFHFHTPSEHQHDGKAYAMEAHLVHQNNAGQLAVIGVFIKEGERNNFLQSIWEIIPETEGESASSDVEINAVDLLPDDNSYYNYRGSLTTPPCSQNVLWHVLETPIEASAEQIDQFTSIYQMNARPPQPRNGRVIRIRQ